MKTHRAFMTQIAARTQMQVLHVDYPLAPEAPYPAALDAVFNVYMQLLDQGVQAKDIILSGDSCGANLALALALKIQKLKLLQPSGLILLSPFVDLTLTSEFLRYIGHMMPCYPLKHWKVAFNTMYLRQSSIAILKYHLILPT